MKRYNGLKVKREGASWIALKEIFPSRTSSELNSMIVERLEKLSQKTGIEFDEDWYRNTLEQFADGLEVSLDFLIMFVLRRWTRKTVQLIKDLEIIGTGECENCGVDELEFADSGEFWKTPDVYECGYCNERQHRRDI